MRRAEFLTGVAGAALSPSSDPRRLRLAALPLAHDIDPYRDTEPGADELAWLYADGLVGWDKGLVPLLAERLPQVADGGRLYRYTLRDVRWHDGRPFVAHDVADAFVAVRTANWGTHQPYRSVREVVVRDKRHFDVVLDSPQHGFVRSFFGPYGTPALPVLRSTDVDLPLGTGPFAVRSRPEAGRWLLERWAGSPRGIPFVGTLDLRLLSSELTAAVQLLSGEADLALPLSPGATGSGRFARVRRFTSTAVLLCNSEGELKTVAARHALAASIDVPRLQRLYDRTRTTLLASLLMDGPNDEAYAHMLSYDPTAASRLKLYLGGRELVVATVAQNAALGRVVAQLASTFEHEGIAYRVVQSPAIRYMGVEGPLRTGRFDIAISGFTYADEPDFEADWSCANRPPAGGNYARWCDTKFDVAVKQGDVTAALRRLYDGMMCIPLSRAYEEIGVGPRVHGFAPPPPGIPATLGCVGWDVR